MNSQGVVGMEAEVCASEGQGRWKCTAALFPELSVG